MWRGNKIENPCCYHYGPTKALISNGLWDLENSEEIFLFLPSDYIMAGSFSELELGQSYQTKLELLNKLCTLGYGFHITHVFTGNKIERGNY